MINIVLKDLDNLNIYDRVLSVSEYLCDEFHLQNDFGIILMANQSIVDYLQLCNDIFSIEMNIFIDSNEVRISFISSKSVFDKVLTDQLSEHPYLHDFSFLSDSYTIMPDNKTLVYTFHVKPYLSTARYLPIEVLKCKHSYL